MSKGRLNTVHDLSSLRLHPDGSRVPVQEHLNVKASSKSVSERERRKNTVRDAAGNWIALDAGGVGAVLKRRRDVNPDEEEGEQVEEEEDEIRAGPSEKAKGKRREVDIPPEEEETISKPRKRRKHTHTQDLAPSLFTSPDSSLQLPSSVRSIVQLNSTN